MKGFIKDWIEENILFDSDGVTGWGGDKASLTEDEMNKTFNDLLEAIESNKENKMEMRKVKYYDSLAINRETSKYEMKELGEAWFHQFGVEFEEFENNAGNYTTAVIELPDGRVLNHPVAGIKFITTIGETKA